MGYSLPYREDFEIEVRDGMVVAPRPEGGTQKIRMRQRIRRRSHKQVVFNPRSLQDQLAERATLIIMRKRASIEPEAAIKLRQVIEGTVDHIFGGGTRAYDEATVAWITYSFNRIDYLMINLISESRHITVQSIEDVLRRLCPLPPVC